MKCDVYYHHEHDMLIESNDSESTDSNTSEKKMTNDFAVLKKAILYTNGYTNDKNMVCLCPRQE